MLPLNAADAYNAAALVKELQSPSENLISFDRPNADAEVVATPLYQQPLRYQFKPTTTLRTGMLLLLLMFYETVY